MRQCDLKEYAEKVATYLCYRCGKELPVSAFHQPAKHATGPQYQECRECINAVRKSLFSSAPYLAEKKRTRKVSPKMAAYYARLQDKRAARLRKERSEKAAETMRKRREAEKKKHSLAGLSFDGCKTQNEKEIRIMNWAMDKDDFNIPEGDAWDEFVIYALNNVKWTKRKDRTCQT